MRDPLERTFYLSDRQALKVSDITGNDDGRYIELPEDATRDQSVKVLDSAGKKVGEITLWQAFSL